MDTSAIRAAVRDIPDFPKQGIIFKDITPVLGNPTLFRKTIDFFCEGLVGRIEKVAVIDARGFLFGGAVAERLNAGLVPIRKKGKLPFKTYEETYDLEYGSATLTIHRDAFGPGERVLLVDDVLATGGTAAASVKLIRQAGGKVESVRFLIELTFLKGRDKVKNCEIVSAIGY